MCKNLSDFDQIGERAARDADGKTYYVPDNMTYREWKKAYIKAVDNGAGSDIMVGKEQGTAGNVVHIVGKIDRKIYSCVTNDITTDEVIITDSQIKHIQENHPNDYENFFAYISMVLEAPDYIIEANKPNTAVVLKTIVDGDNLLKLILRLHTSADPEKYCNSIITFMRIDEKTQRGLLRNKKVLYKRE